MGRSPGQRTGFSGTHNVKTLAVFPLAILEKKAEIHLRHGGKEIIPPVCRCVIPSFRSTVFRYCQARPSRIHPGIKIIINNTDNSQLAQTFPHFFSHTLLLHRPSSASMFRYRQTILRIGAPLGLTGKHAAKSRSAE